DVMEMLIDIDESSKSPTEYVRDLVEGGDRVPGFGHRVYKKMDPRAVVLKEMSRQLSEATDGTDWYAVLSEVETYLREEENIDERGIYPNVDFYSGSVYYSLGIPTDMFISMFAMGRCIGWIAQLLEQYADNRLMRPRANYVGPRDLEYTPMDER
ncbi:MAG: citrate/2-methylcitrate synthase, partial [Halobacteria archaeon]|nr:citrate/2-methylcitrate synthase [Halobacteria archaeon]